uniref:G_PROTEIN_RECEP_F1_2 domain-containing protein n=1 Tax=Syphacia muris TaxID=451379 RepID=A0A0N5ALE6_9BILA
MIQNRFKTWKITVYLLLIFVAVIGNALVCITSAIDEQLKKREEKVLNFSLATADFMVVLAMLCAVTNNYWRYGETMCRVWVALTVTSSTASILNLCALSMSRFYSISRPFLYITKKNRLVAILILWIAALLLGCIDIFIEHKALAAENTSYVQLNELSGVETNQRNTCIFTLEPVYAIICMTVSFFIPAAVMVVYYVRLYICAEGHRRAIQKQIDINQYPLKHLTYSDRQLFRCFRHLTLCYNDRMHADNSVDAANTIHGCGHRARKTLVVVVGTFMICWLPFNIICIYRLIQPTSLTELAEILLWLGYANSAANPLIFWSCNKNFKQACQRVLSKICCRQSNQHLHYCDRHFKRSQIDSKSVILPLALSPKNLSKNRENRSFCRMDQDIICISENAATTHQKILKNSID